MLSPDLFLVFIAAVLQFGGIFWYIRRTLKDLTKPNKVSWLMWGLPPIIAAIAAFADGARWEVLPVFFSGFVSILVCIAALTNRRSYWKLGSFDYLCGVFSLLALILWAIVKDPNIAIICAICSDIFASIPTFQKFWQHPGSDAITPFVTGLFATTMSFFMIDTWHFSSYAFPTYLVVMNTGLIFAFQRHKFFPKKTAALK